MGLGVKGLGFRATCWIFGTKSAVRSGFLIWHSGPRFIGSRLGCMFVAVLVPSVRVISSGLGRCSSQQGVSAVPSLLVHLSTQNLGLSPKP